MLKLGKVIRNFGWKKHFDLIYWDSCIDASGINLKRGRINVCELYYSELNCFQFLCIVFAVNIN